MSDKEVVLYHNDTEDDLLIAGFYFRKGAIVMYSEPIPKSLQQGEESMMLNGMSDKGCR